MKTARDPHQVFRANFPTHE
ncbi:hypothetical protein [Nonomuraea jabiensis]